MYRHMSELQLLVTVSKSILACFSYAVLLGRFR